MLRTNLRKRVDVKLCTLCHGPTGPAKQFYQVSLSSLPLDGSELYDLTCSGCHGLLADSEVEGESAAEIQEKINENEGGMGPLGALKTNQIQAIAAALGGDTTPLPPPTPGDGVTLYAQHCATCHGDLANSEKKGASAGSIQSAIDSNQGGMGSLGALTTQQIQDIAGALAPVVGNNDCEADLDNDGTVDGSDLALFSSHFGRTDCSTSQLCVGDFDNDGDVDGSDSSVFAKDFGRQNCQNLASQ